MYLTLPSIHLLLDTFRKHTKWDGTLIHHPYMENCLSRPLLLYHPQPWIYGRTPQPYIEDAMGQSPNRIYKDVGLMAGATPEMETFNGNQPMHKTFNLYQTQTAMHQYNLEEFPRSEISFTVIWTFNGTKYNRSIRLFLGKSKVLVTVNLMLLQIPSNNC